MEAKLGAEIKTIREKIDTNHEKMETNQEEVDTFLEKMKANPGELQCVAVHQKVPNEEATVETIGALEEQYGGAANSQRNGPRAMVGSGRSWPLPADG
jgi:hypothetical protein